MDGMGHVTLAPLGVIQGHGVGIRYVDFFCVFYFCHTQFFFVMLCVKVGWESMLSDGFIPGKNTHHGISVPRKRCENVHA